MVRITVQGMQEAKACAEIKKKLVEDGYNTPLIADIHFAPKVAMMVAECFDKIRVNPGNFADGGEAKKNGITPSLTHSPSSRDSCCRPTDDWTYK